MARTTSDEDRTDYLHIEPMMLILTGEAVGKLGDLAAILGCDPGEAVGVAIERLWKERFRLNAAGVAD